MKIVELIWTINLGEENDEFSKAIGVALHPSGDIAVLDTVSLSLTDPPRVYVIRSNGTRNFVLTSTGSDGNPVDKLRYALDIDMTTDGKYVIPDSNLVKLFDIKGIERVTLLRFLFGMHPLF